MNKKFRIAGIAAALAVSAIILSSPSQPPPLPPPTAQQNEAIKILATNLQRPWAVAFAQDRIFVTEKGGDIRVIDSDTLLEEPLATLRVAKVFGGGLLGIATHPDFENNHFLYVYYTYSENDTLWNKVLRITESDNKIIDASTIIDRIPGSQFYNGGVIKFGPDGKLYVATGLSSEFSHNAQDPSSLEGKILRLNDDGTIPSDNPFAGSPVFSLGHRDPQGMAWDKNGNLFVTEFGPTKNDEINLVRAGQNYGWPEQECGGKFVGPIMCYDPSIEPGGIVFYSGDKLGYTDSLIMATLRGANLYKLEVSEDGVLSQKSILSGLGRIRDASQGPDGYLYVITSNTDGKGFPDKTDDKLIRILK
ncbi:MAG TPA: PQQ-dependent sugar dehydrogenase [Candidatus Nitrosotenuis sp.]|nr:PQQ-dependent sugar dehydrogenase [Candidatus Nitrosotenuis sp.]